MVINLFMSKGTLTHDLNRFFLLYISDIVKEDS